MLSTPSRCTHTSGVFLPSRVQQPDITAERKNLLTTSRMPGKEGGNYVNPGSTAFAMLHTWVLATNSFFQKLAACVCVWSLTALCLKIVCPSELGEPLSKDGQILEMATRTASWTNQTSNPLILCPISCLLSIRMKNVHCTLYTLPREWRTWHTWNKMRILKIVVMKTS